ncbi:AAA family ATPase [Acidovorax sp. NCPPB 2350]|nr:AAA family ATPase [Acidovorax sp. NCPPB 2350]
MKLTRVRLENFGPFNGNHEIDLTVTANAPVILIHGENERGKTSLANAIRWCLYKQAVGRNSIHIPTVRLLNTDARLGGQYNLSVTLEFEHAGARFILERHAQAGRAPSDDRDFQFRCSMRKNGSFEPEAGIDRSINEILHQQISRFFLFDGEMLNDYEDLLRDPYRRTVIVKQSIEQILGLPSIQRSVTGLAELKRIAERSQLSEARARRDNERLIASAQQKEEQVSALEKDIQRQQEIRAGLENERNQLRQQMETFGEIRADLREMDRCEREIKQADEDAATLTEDIQTIVKESWWLPLEKAIAAKAEEAQTLAQRAAEASLLRERLTREIAEVDRTVLEQTCGLCGHHLLADEISALSAKRATAQSQLDGQGPVIDAAKHFEMMTLLRPFAGKAAHQVLREKEGALRRTGIKKRQLKTEIDQIKERVRTDYRSEIGQVERDLEKCLGQLRDSERILGETQDRRNEADATLQRLQAQIRKLPLANKGLATQAALFEALREIFDSAVEEFRQRLRVDVEREASEIHKALSADPGYGGLKINEQFGLSLMNDRGRIITDRSAGSEQIVALSLIGALNRCATREGPIIMDTPFGRLDRRHRHNILKFAPNFGAQVVLLVQSGELERDRDLVDLAPHVAREYRVERDGASDRSKITEITS